MRIINRLREPGKIRSVRLDEEIVRVRLVGDEEIIYRRVKDEREIPTEGQESHRFGTLH